MSEAKGIKVLAAGAGANVVGKFLGRFLAVAGDIVAARILGPAMFGLYSIGWTLLRILGLIAPLGLPNGVLRYIPRYLRDDEGAVKGVLLQSILISSLSGICVGGLMYGLAPWLAESVYQKPALTEIFRVFAVCVPFMALLSIAAAISRSTQGMTYSVLIEDVGQPLFGLIFVILIYWLAGRWLIGVIFSDLISYFIAAFLALWVVRKMFLRFLAAPGRPGYLLAEMLSFSLPTALAGTFSVFVFWVDRLLVGYFLPEVQNGLYQAASQTSVLFVLVVAAFNAILSPMFADLHAKGDLAQMQEIFCVGTKWGLYLSIPAFLVYFFAPHETLSVLYGENFVGGWLALVILAVGQLVNVATGSVGMLLSMSGHQRLWMWLSFVSIVLNIVLCSILIPAFGIAGAAMSTSISLTVMYLIGIFRARSLLGIWPYDRRYLKGLTAAFGSAAALLVLRIFYAGPFILTFILVGLLSTAGFFGLLLWFGLDREDREVYQLFSNFLSKEKKGDDER